MHAPMVTPTGEKEACKIKGPDRPTPTLAPIDNIGENDVSSNAGTVTWAEIEAFAADLAEAHPFWRVRWIVGLAFLWSLPMRAREEAVELALDGGTPWPPPFISVSMAWAREWAASQPRPVVKAYALATFEALPAADRAAFLSYVTGRAAA